MWSAVLAAVLTAGYSIILPEATLPSVTIATGTLFFALLFFCCTSTEKATSADFENAGLLTIIFCSYQYFLRDALRSSTLSLAIVNLNILLIGLYEIWKRKEFDKIIELVFGSIAFILLSYFLATLLPRKDVDSSKAGNDTQVV